MPDRVKVPSGVPITYRGVYQQVCENQDPESIASSFIHKAEKDIRRLGQSGDALIEEAIPYLGVLAGYSLLREMTGAWGEEHTRIDNLAISIPGDRFHLECAVEACKQILVRVERGEIIEDVKAETKKERLLVIYSACVEEVYMDADLANCDYEAAQRTHASVRRCIKEKLDNKRICAEPFSISELLEFDNQKV